LPLLRLPRKFVHLESKNNLQIVCSSIGKHPVTSTTTTTNNDLTNANQQIIWLSYSDLNVIHIYKIEISSKHLLEPKISINKIKSLPLACGNRPAVLMKLFNYQDNSNLRLCYLTNKSCLQCLKLDDSGFMLESVIQCIQQDNLTDNRIYMMACKNDLVATADTDLNVFIWNLKNQQLLASLPRYESLTTCFSFHPTMSYLLNCYADRKVNI